MKKTIPFLLCILLLLCGCSKPTEPLSFENADSYVTDFSDDFIVLHPKESASDTKIKIEIDTTSMDIIKNDVFVITGTAIAQKDGYTMDKNCIVSKKFDADSLEFTDEVLYTDPEFIIVNTSRRNIKIYFDGNAFSVFDIVYVSGKAQKTEPKTVSRDNDSDLTFTYEMKNATVIKEPEITE